MAVITIFNDKFKFLSAPNEDLVSKIPPFTRWSTWVLPEIPDLVTKRNLRALVFSVLVRCICQELGPVDYLLLHGCVVLHYLLELMKALQAIKSSLIDPNKTLSNWDQGDPCTSNWTGVVCNNTIPDDGYLHVQQLDFMWNSISGTIPKEIGSITSLELLLLNGNQLTGFLPEELGNLPNLNRIQIDENHISGPIPTSFANLNATQHFQLDNNNFNGATIPASYSKMSNLLKLSLRNCSLQGPIPDLSQIPNLYYLDLSSNQLNGTIPSNRLSGNMTTMSIANNSLNGSVPSIIWQNRTLNGTKKLTVELQNNKFSNITGTTDLFPNVAVWLQGNPLCLNSSLSHFCGFEPGDENSSQSSTNTTSVCLAQECAPPFEYSNSSTAPVECFCAAPLFVGYRLKSPGFLDFRPYKDQFEEYLTTGLQLLLYQLYIESFAWENGHRLGMQLKLFPVYDASSATKFNMSEVHRIFGMFTSWSISDNDLFGPYELISFPLTGFYKDENDNSPSPGLSKGALAGMVLGTIAGAVTLSAVVTLLILRVYMRKNHSISRRRHSDACTITKALAWLGQYLSPTSANAVDQASAKFGLAHEWKHHLEMKRLGCILAKTTTMSKASIKIDGVKDFTFEEMVMATNNFNSSTLVGQGGYGQVYEGILADGTVVAIKRAREGSLQGETEFLTEIELLSRLHHRNLVSLIGYCDEEGEQGYLDPEYFLTYKLTDKSDVYSLGVVFLELLTGMQPISHGKNIVREVNAMYQSGMIFSIIDRRMRSYPSKCVVRFLTMALKCCEEETDARPSIAEVVRELESIWHMMPDSDIRSVAPMVTDAEKVVTTPSSSSTEKIPYASFDVSGGELVSGVVPTITPR
ncbi:hypothetical protein CMV_000745 [Castanea mollissima]|uniref:non-specific serine/threonine protein kinase n=1 Tax=Castanea mollissima TaxID=60419 RepID=A0A8J4RSR5_9ROSI|nr:hypothetical protein CMV_000745 [Castanea mollissima]